MTKQEIRAGVETYVDQLTKSAGRETVQDLITQAQEYLHLLVLEGVALGYVPGIDQDSLPEDRQFHTNTILCALTRLVATQKALLVAYRDYVRMSGNTDESVRSFLTQSVNAISENWEAAR